MNDCHCQENGQWLHFPFGTSYYAAIAPLLLALVCAAPAMPGLAQYTDRLHSTDRAGLEKVLGLEEEPVGGVPGGWQGDPIGTIFADEKVVHGGRWSARIERHTDSPSGFSKITNSIPMDFAGTMIELRGFLRTEDVSGFVGLWMREDGESRNLALENMQSRQLKGTTGWTEYAITLPVKPEGRRLFFGVLLAGTGKAWADDLQLLVDGKPIWEAPKAEWVKTVLDFDHQFDNGSGVVVDKLTRTQVANLVALGKVWGFLKYYHPQVNSGHRHWDYDLLRVLPAILGARDRARANAVIVQWIEGLGPVAPCNPFASLDDLQISPDLRWIGDEARLGRDLSGTLRWVRDNRLVRKQFYVSLAPNVRNPVFDHELGYSGLKLPDAGFQLLALYRFWNIVEYWSPYRDVLREDWDRVLAEFIPKIALARDRDNYQRQLMMVIARAHDGHAGLWSSVQARPPVGTCRLPVRLSFVENQPVVSGYMAGEDESAQGLSVGDIITKLDGVPVARLVEKWEPYYSGSNEAARLRDIARFMTRGECGDSTVSIRRGRHDMDLAVKRVPLGAGDLSRLTHDLPGETFRLLSDQVAYLKLSSVKASQAADYISRAAGTRGLIIDIRNYPSEFVVFALGSLLVDRQAPFVRFTNGDLSNPGAFHWTQAESLSPQKPHYAGKIVILVDETTQSSAEYTTMAFRTAPGALVVGSTTAGADGNVSQFALPGGLSTMISGIGVFYPDKQPTQRIGIIPNVEVKPTIEGIRAARDEVLEEAVRQILGRGVSEAQIEKMYRR
jgi:C-terminal processing protease CtpA/Prc